MFRDAGWTQAIVSNHCPELESLVDGLGIGGFFDKVYSSVCTGYEKPHPRAIGLALEHFEVDVAWMIGNSAKSDIGAADAAGIPSVLVVRDGPTPLVDARRWCSVRVEHGLTSARRVGQAVTTE